MEIKITEVFTRGFLLEILLHIYNAQQTKLSLAFYSLLLLANYKSI